MITQAKRRQHIVWRGIQVHSATYDALLQLRRPDDSFNGVIERLLRFHKRFRPAGEVQIREEYLP